MAKAAAEKTEIAKVAAGAIVAPEFFDGADFGAGFEGADKDSFAIPFLQILQKMSPMVDEDAPTYVEGAKAGMVYNTVTKQLYDVRETPLEIIPCFHKRSFIQWGPRDDGGGFKGEVTPDEMATIVARGDVELVDGRYLVKDEKGNTDPKKSDYYADTRSYFVIAIDPETKEGSPAILSLASSQIKPSKMLMTALGNRKVVHAGVKRTPPMFMNRVLFSTNSLSNDKGTWAGAKFDIVPEYLADKELYEMSKEFYSQVKGGDVAADYSKAVDAGDSKVAGAPADADKF